jgi:predicted nucleic acid-binding Zn ribbon protein
VNHASDEPVPLADALAAVRAELGLSDGVADARLEREWDAIVGTEVAAHARLQTVRDGVLVIAVDSPIWATELRYLEGEIVARAAAAVGPGVVTSIRVRVG